MSKEQQQADLEDAFIDFAADYPRTASEMIIGLMVGLLELSVERAGGDPAQRIVIESDGRRTITIHEMAASKGEQP